jgi:hypothetical protein
MAYSKKAHLLTNTEAIRIAFALDREKRRATEAERAVLRQYSGFGGLKCILKPAQTEQDKAYWTKSDMDLFPLTVDLHRLIRENSKDDREYKVDIAGCLAVFVKRVQKIPPNAPLPGYIMPENIQTVICPL